jgi:hypothetical protein
MTTDIFWEFGSGRNSVHLFYKAGTNIYRMCKVCIESGSRVSMSSCAPVELCPTCAPTPFACLKLLESKSVTQPSTPCKHTRGTCDGCGRTKTFRLISTVKSAIFTLKKAALKLVDVEPHIQSILDVVDGHNSIYFDISFLERLCKDKEFGRVVKHLKITWIHKFITNMPDNIQSIRLVPLSRIKYFDYGYIQQKMLEKQAFDFVPILQNYIENPRSDTTEHTSLEQITDYLHKVNTKLYRVVTTITMVDDVRFDVVLLSFIDKLQRTVVRAPRTSSVIGPTSTTSYQSATASSNVTYGDIMGIQLFANAVSKVITDMNCDVCSGGCDCNC